jgi:hypothetical protein
VPAKTQPALSVERHKELLLLGGGGGGPTRPLKK